LESSSSLVQKTSNVNLSSSEGVDTSSLDSSQTDAKRILAQVAEWLHQQKAKKSRKKKKKKRRRHAEKPVGPDEVEDDDDDDVDESDSEPTGSRPGSDFNLEALEGILAGYMKSSTGSTPRLLPKSPNLLARRGSIAKKFKRHSLPPQSSDTEFFGEDILVPNVEADLDNTKTLAYTGGAADSEGGEKLKKKDQKNWNTFKQEILRLTHTLKLKGWRRIPMEYGGELEVSRLSGKGIN
jgi:choline kinase